MKIKHLKERTGLIEGRRKELEFAFLTKKENCYEPEMAFSTCKDYLNDVIFAEKFKRNAPLVYGFTAIYKDLFKNNNRYLGFKVRGREEICEKLLKDNINNLLFLINDVEDQFKMETRSSLEITNVDDLNKQTVYILHFPKEWLVSTIAISLYSYLIRIGFELDEKKTVKKIRESDLKDLSKKMQLYEFIYRFHIILNKGLDCDDYINESSEGRTIHNKGFFREYSYSPYDTISDPHEDIKKIKNEILNKQAISVLNI